ncbi:MAG: hypothetical protein HUJ86_08070, partial [Synergistes sp.]|nr:hypothetical protein [Synergistes sp.]
MKVKTAGEWFLWIIFSVILYLIGIGVPFLSPLVLLAAPAPIMIVVRSRGFREGFLGALFGTLLVYIAVGPVSAFLYT